MPLRIPLLITIASLASLVLLPWPFAALGLVASSLAFPPAGFALGAVADMLYYPGRGLPWWTLLGVFSTLLALLVRHFVKTRII